MGVSPFIFVGGVDKKPESVVEPIGLFIDGPNATT